MKFYSSVLSETFTCVVGVCSWSIRYYLCWCFLLFIFWTGGERVFTLVAIKRTVSHKIMMMMITTNYSHWLQQGPTPSDRLPHGFFRQTSIGAASEARCLSLSDWIVIWCISNCAMYVIWEICWVFNLMHSFISLNCRRYCPLSLSLNQAWIESHLRCSSLAMSRVETIAKWNLFTTSADPLVSRGFPKRSYQANFQQLPHTAAIKQSCPYWVGLSIPSILIHLALE